MVYIISTNSDAIKLENILPDIVINEAKRVSIIFDDNYNSKGNDGGYILIAENERDLEIIKRNHIDISNERYELADILDDNNHISILYLSGTEYAINIIMPISLMSDNII